MTTQKNDMAALSRRLQRLEIENAILRAAAFRLRQRNPTAGVIFDAYVRQQAGRGTTPPAHPALTFGASGRTPEGPRQPGGRQRRDAELLILIQKVYTVSARTFGARRIWRELNEQGVPVARSTVERLMRSAELSGRSGRGMTAAIQQDERTTGPAARVRAN